MSNTITKRIDASPDPYSDTMSAVMTALRAGIINDRMNDLESSILQRLHDIAIGYDNANEKIAEWEDYNG